MKASGSKWPFRPVHITNDGEEFLSSDLSRLTGVGIIPNEYLQGIETVICANLRRPTAIIEFSPAREMVRTDSPLLQSDEDPFGFHPACKIFRKYTDNKCCKECDRIHAELFYHLNRNDFDTEIKKKIAQSEYIKEYRRDKRIHFALVKCARSWYLEYDCPFLGFRELIFPVFFENKVISLFFTGQICLEERQKFIIDKQEELSSNRSDFLNRYSGEAIGSGVERIDEIKDKILRAHKEWVEKYPMRLLKAEHYAELVTKSNKGLCGLEERLNDQMRLQRAQHVRECVDEQIKRFNDDLLCEEVPSGERQRHLVDNIERRLDEIVESFAVRYVLVFGSESITRAKVSLLSVVASSGDMPTGLRECIDSDCLKFNMDKLIEQVGNRSVDSVKYPDIFDALEGFPGIRDKELNLIRVFPVPLFPQATRVVLVGYYDWNPLSAPENGPEGYVGIGLMSFYVIVLSATSSILAAEAEKNMIVALRVLSHESQQLNFGLEGIRERYLADVRRLKRVSEHTAQRLCRHIAAYFRQLDFLFTQFRMAVEELPEPDKSRFWVYEEILYKWEEMYCLQAEYRGVCFDAFHPTRTDPNYPQVYGDKILLEQLVYNLVSNAVKYSYQGTKIKIECIRLGKARDPHVLSVTNYGREFKCKNPFEMSARGTNVEGIEGVGIGLYNAQRIARAHGSRIEVECDKVCDFNVAVMEPYIKSTFKGKDESLVESLKRGLERLEESGEYDRIVAYGDQGLRLYNPEGYELVDLIREPTYKVTIKMSIPAKGS